MMATGTGGIAYLPSKLAGKFDGSADKLKDVKFIFGSQALLPRSCAHFGFQDARVERRTVFGIKSRGNGRLMFEQGEANIDYQTSAAYLKSVVPLVKSGKATPMMTWGALDSNGNIEQDPTFPDLPTFKEVCKKTKSLRDIR